MTSLKLPASLVITMANVRSVLPSAFLAGGALRDLDNGRPIKDYDVFFTDDFEIGLLDDVLLEDNYAYKRSCPGEYMDAAKEVKGTFTYFSLKGQPELNFIELDKSFNPARIIDRMDFGLCQIGYSAIGVVDTTSYEFDKANQCFTLTRAETVDGVRRSLKRYKRLSGKYPGWRLNVPAEFRAIAKDAEDAESHEAAFIALVEDTF